MFNLGGNTVHLIFTVSYHKIAKIYLVVKTIERNVTEIKVLSGKYSLM